MIFLYFSDAQRIDAIKFLIEEEKIEDKILVSHDIHTKHRLVSIQLPFLLFSNQKRE